MRISELPTSPKILYTINSDSERLRFIQYIYKTYSILNIYNILIIYPTHTILKIVGYSTYIIYIYV